MYGTFKCGHSKKPSNRQVRGDGKGCGYGCRACKNRRTREWMAKHPEWCKLEARKLHKRATAPRLKRQRGCCAICKRKLKYPYLDHNHKCTRHNKYSSCEQCRRGMLCPSCNGGMHMFDNNKIFKAAIAYLKKWETQWIRRNTLSE